LANYELDELKETMEAAKTLNAEKNGVKISHVLDAVLQSQIAQLEAAIKRKGKAEFQKAYDATLSACNGCHGEAGVKFIHIIRPSAPPVTNQRWESEAK
jgi:cytochrome c553